jgi:glucosamine--fructose-6-phosphate aminotransferase (isomerizing)
MTNPRGQFTLHEILSQPAAWHNALDVTRSQAAALKTLADGADQVIFTGCGSTYYLSLAAAALFQELTGKPARGVPGSELLLNSDAYLVGRTDSSPLLVAVSRSGTTTETIRATEAFKANGRGPVIVISNYPDTPLAKLGDLALIIPAGQEESVAQTRSFASMYVAVTALACIAAGRDDLLAAMSGLPAVGERLLAQYAGQAKQIGENLDFDRFYFLGSGGRYGLACEVNLKMKEMTLTHSEPFHFLEFRHGPMSMVTPGAVVVGLLSEKNAIHERAVLDEMRAKGATILALSENAADVSFASGLPEAVRGVLYLPVLQLTACYRSLAKGLNPDSPANLTAVVYLDI